MAKQSGLGANFYWGGYDLSGDVGSIDRLSSPIETQDVTGLKVSGHERLLTLRDGNIQFTSFFNIAAGAEHAALSSLPRTDQIGSLFMPPLAIGTPTASVVGKQIGYDPTRDNKGAITFKVESQGNGYGLEWGLALTAGLRTDTVATGGSSLNNGAATTFGAQAHLQVTAFTGTSVDVKVEHSTDNATWSTLIDFGSIAAANQALRGTVSGTVDQYVRATTGAGTFSSITFALAFSRNAAAVSF